MNEKYIPITSMKKVSGHLRKLRRQYLRYQQAVSNFKRGDVSPAIDLFNLLFDRELSGGLGNE